MLSNVSFVMVTYGDRMKYVFEAIKPILSSTNAIVIIVCNGVDDSSYECLNHQFEKYLDHRLVVIRNAANEGSAGGFYVGLERALFLGKEYSFLLDDDNYLDPDSLLVFNEKLKSPLETACVCYRRDRCYMTDLINGMSASKVFPKQNSFMGFSFSRLANKLKKSEIRSDSDRNGSINLHVQWAPYGGLIIRTEWLNHIGLPRRDYYLYADDTEFTYRVKIKHDLVLLPDILIDDLEKSWNVASNRNLFSRLLLDGENWKVFYSVRNQAHFDFNIYGKSKGKVIFNALFFFVIITMFFLRGLIHNKQSSRLITRYFLLFKACVRGVTGNLGKIND